MADDENRTDAPAEKSEEQAEAQKPSVKKSATRRAPAKKAAAKKTANTAGGESAAAAKAAPSTRVAPASAAGTRAVSETARPAPPKQFWWKALLMIAAVLFVFAIVRYMAKESLSAGAPAREAASAIPAPLPGNIDKLAAQGEIIVEEAPSAPPTPATALPPALYGYSFPQPQPYYQMPPQAAALQGQPAWPAAPPGSYVSPYMNPYWMSPYPFRGPRAMHRYTPPYPWAAGTAPESAENEQQSAEGAD